jgi:hypothetical protein
MKLIALKNLARVPAMADVKIENAVHERHIHKGAIFEIGTGETLHDLKRDEGTLAALLLKSEAVGYADDPQVVARVQAEIAAEQKAERNTQKLHEQLSGKSLATELLAVFSKLAATAPTRAR